MSRSSTSSRPQTPVRSADKTLQVTASPKQRADQGICVSCIHRPTCLFREAARHPIFFCEEFDDQVIPGEPAVETKSAQVAPAEPQINYGEAQELGLCANCNTKTECMNRRPGVAVWHCEDYS
jgi:hypothetical protein